MRRAERMVVGGKTLREEWSAMMRWRRWRFGVGGVEEEELSHRTCRSMRVVRLASGAGSLVRNMGPEEEEKKWSTNVAVPGDKIVHSNTNSNECEGRQANEGEEEGNLESKRGIDGNKVVFVLQVGVDERRHCEVLRVRELLQRRKNTRHVLLTVERNVAPKTRARMDVPCVADEGEVLERLNPVPFLVGGGSTLVNDEAQDLRHKLSSRGLGLDGIDLAGG